MAEEGEQSENKLFSKVKYKISGNLTDSVVEILKNGGAEGSNYFSDYHTHCIVGTDPADTDITDAKELYEIPAVKSEWVSLSYKCGKLLPVKPFLFGEETLFTNVTACLSEVSRGDCSALWGMIKYYGGACSLKLTPRTTHLIVGKARGAKYEFAIRHENNNRYIVTPDWVLDSISFRNRAQEALYHPRLLIEPEREKKNSDLVANFSTAHITGFADDEVGIKEEDGGNAKLSNELLEHLKQSMPWNQQMGSSTPPTPSSSTFSSNSLMTLDIKEEPKLPSLPTTPASVPQSPVNAVPQSKPQPQQLMQQVQQKSQIILQQQRLQQLTPTSQIAWRGQAPVSQQQQPQQLLIQQQQLQVAQGQQQLQVSQAQQQLQVSQAQQLQVTQAQQQLQVSQAQQQLQVSQAQQQQLQLQQQLQAQPQQQQSVLVQQQAQLIQQQTQQQQIITQTIQQQPQIIQQQQQPNILQQNIIQQAPPNLVQQPQTQNLGQQQIISQQTTLLLSPQNQLESQQFITTQQQLIQRPQQSKPAIQQQQFVVREGTPQLQQQQFTEKPVQFQWQQQYNQNRQQLVATPQVQPRQIAWMQPQQGVRQLIQMDAQTHAQLQQMDPAQRTLFLQRFQKQRQIALQRQLQAQQQNRGIVEQGGQVQFGVVRMNQPQPQQTTVIQRQMQPGINQLQWIQQQRQNQIRQQALVQQQPGQQGATLIRTPVGAQAAAQHQRLPVNVIPQGATTQQQQQQPPQQQQQQPQQQQQQQQPSQQQWQTVDGSCLPQQAVPGSTQQQISPSQQQQQQIIIRHQQLQLQRLQQLQLQKQQQQQQLQQQQQQQQQQQPPQPPQTPTPGPQRVPHYVTQVNMLSQGNSQPGVLIQQHSTEQLEPSTSTDLFGVTNGAGQGQPQLVNPKTKTALANMLSSRLQSGGVTAGVDGSAASQLRMMTAQHQAASLPPPPPPQPAAHPYQRTTLGNVNTAPPSLTRGSDLSPSVTMAKPAYSAQTAARVAAVLAKSASGTPPANHQHRPQFYGHTPNFKIPADLFLLGCVFLIMEYDRTGYDVTTWRRIILENGGETELTYSPRVTHILCQTQKHPLVQQGLRDGKRCVTAEWLSDVILKQQVLPPWLALHFPTPFSDEKPCRNLIICHSGFEGDERIRVKKMIEAVGAKMTSYYTSHNNILVCRRPEGEKYKKAREWGRSVVNVQWLNEVLFGHFSCLQHPENQKYQQFNIGNPFRIDYTLVPHLMGAWKVPIQVTLECCERAKSSGIVGPKRKRPRLTSPTNTQNMFEQENMFPIDSVIPPINHGRPIVLLSGSATKTEDERKIYQLGGLVAKSYREATHLVMHKIQRTFKLMCCLSTCKYIVSAKWLNDSFQNERFLDEQAYIIEDQEFETKHNCSVQKVLFNPNRSRLFSGKTFFITPGVTPSRAALSEMVHAAGGHVEKQRKSLKHIQELDPESYITVTVWNDFHLVSDLIRANVPVYSAEFIMTAILTQKLPYETAFRKSVQKNKN